MANNRMYLECKGCGEKFFIGKRFGDAYYISEYPQVYDKPFKTRLNDFYENHFYCKGESPDCFKISYEFEGEE